MTIIVYNKQTGEVAADRRIALGTAFSTQPKLFQLDTNEVVGYVGSVYGSVALEEWYKLGADPKTVPTSNSTSCDALLVVFRKDMYARVYEIGQPYPIVDRIDIACYGSGRKYAAMAMRCNAKITNVIPLVAEFDSGCSAEYDYFELSPYKEIK